MRVLQALSVAQIVRSALKTYERTDAKICFFIQRKRSRFLVYLRNFSIVNMSGEGEAKVPFKRLPKSVVPANYQITLQPNLENFKFKGSQIVDIEVSISYNCRMSLVSKLLCFFFAIVHCSTSDRWPTLGVTNTLQDVL